MPNYAITINSKFRPFEYNELVQPIIAATQAQYQLEDAYSEISSKASIWDKLANESTDPRAHATYKKFAEDLRMRADDLINNDLNPYSRKAFSDLRSRYSSDIVPIANAYKKREAQEQAQMQALMQNPTLIFSRRAGTTSLDDYLNNPELGYDVTSGALIAKQVSDIGTKLSTLAKEGEEGKNKLRKLLPYQYERIEQKGFRPEDIQKAIMQSPDADKILTNLVDEVLQASGINNWGFLNEADKNNALKQARQYANMGLYSAIRETQKSILKDEWGMKSAEMALNYHYSKKLAEDRARAEKEIGNHNPVYITTNSNLKVSGDREQITKDLAFAEQLLDNYKKTGNPFSSFSNKVEGATLNTVPVFGSSVVLPKSGSYSVSTTSPLEAARKRGLEIAAKYGWKIGDDPENLIKNIKSAQRKSIIGNQAYIFNTTDNARLVNNLYDIDASIKEFNEEKSYSSTFKNKKEEREALFNMAKANDVGKNYRYEPEVGFIASYVDDDNHRHSYLVAPESYAALPGFADLMDSTNGYYNNYINTENAGDLENFITNLDAMMNSIYTLNNKRAFSQGVTSEKEAGEFTPLFK